jgi:hypothetical protein
MNIPAPPKVNPSAAVLKGRDAAMLGARAIVAAQLVAAGIRVVEEGEEPTPRPAPPPPLHPIDGAPTASARRLQEGFPWAQATSGLERVSAAAQADGNRVNDRAAFEDGYNVGKREGYSAGVRKGVEAAVEILASAPPPPIVIHVDQLPAWLTGRRMVEGDL